jgi:hypothetical protein
MPAKTLILLQVMKALLVIICIFGWGFANAQTYVPGVATTLGRPVLNSKHSYDSIRQKKWFFTKYSGITAGYTFFSGGHASYLAAPFALQINRRVTNNVYAFAGASLTPAYINFNNAFPNTCFNKNITGKYNPNSFSINPAAYAGLMYINNDRTFSISGSISIERNNYPYYYPVQSNTQTHNNLPVYR